MDKTVSISLGGYAFTMDDAAYQKLKSYLNDIKISLTGTDGIDEIISDVESRIAELLQPSLKNKQVLDVEDVNGVIDVMGTPEQYAGEDLEDDSPASSTTYEPKGTYKKLFRSREDGWIGGVCSGLAKYFDIDPLWVRAIFAAPLLLTIFVWFLDFGTFTGFSIVSYIVLWIIVPVAKSTSDKILMEGKQVNFDSIKEFSEKAADNVSRAASDVRPAAGRFLEVVGKILLMLIGVVLLINSIGWIISGLTLMFGSIFGMFSLWEYAGYLFDNKVLLIIGMNLAALLLIIPGIFLAMLAFRLFSKRFKLRSRTLIIMGVVWLFSLIGAAVIAGTYSSNFWMENETTEIKKYDIESDTITLTLNQYKESDNLKQGRWISNDSGLFKQDGKIFSTNVRYRIYESDSDQVEIEVEYEGRGRTLETALENSNHINYNYEISGNEFVFDEFFSLDSGEKFRIQEVYVKIYIPEGKTFYIKDFYGLRIDDYFHHDDWDLDDKYFKYEDSEAICTTCENDEEDENWEFSDDEGGKSFKITNDNGTTVDVTINKDGVKVTENDEDKIIISKDSIKIQDDNDTLRINNSGN